MALSVTNLVGFGGKRAAAGGGAGFTLVGLITDNANGTFDFPGGTAVGDLCIVFEYAASASNAGSAIAPTGWTVANDGVTDAYNNSGGDYVGYYKVLTSTSTVTSGYISPSTDLFVGAVYSFGSTITVSSVNDVGTETAANPSSQALNASGSTDVIYCGMAKPTGQYSASFTPDTTMTDGTQFTGAWLYQATGTNETWDDDGSGGSETIISYWLEVTA